MEISTLWTEDQIFKSNSIDHIVRNITQMRIYFTSPEPVKNTAGVWPNNKNYLATERFHMTDSKLQEKHKQRSFFGPLGPFEVNGGKPDEVGSKSLLQGLQELELVYQLPPYAAVFLPLLLKLEIFYQFPPGNDFVSLLL